jgi:lipopolysaccharide export system ATP-binding protein
MIFDSILFCPKATPILRGVYLKLEAGHVCGLFGPNGCGKSTLMKIGAGLLRPTDGSVFVDDRQFLSGSFLSRYQRIAYMPQDSLLPRDMKVKTFLQSLPQTSRDYILSHLQHQRLQQSIGSLSGGELRLFELLFVLSLNRNYLLLDEPFTGIEPLYIEKMMALISQQRALGKGVLLTDHYYRYTAQVADYGYYMNDGQCLRLMDNVSMEQQLYDHGYMASPKNNQAWFA